MGILKEAKLIETFYSLSTCTIVIKLVKLLI